MKWLERRWVRGVCVVATVLATVATSEPSWSLSDATTERAISLEVGATHAAAAHAESNYGDHPEVTLEITPKGVPLGARLVVRRTACGSVDTVFQVENGEWCEQREANDLCRTPLIVAVCGDPVRVELVNDGPQPLELGYFFKAEISKDGDDEAPDGVYVRIEEIEP